jgi:hypothetical protein
VTSVPRVQERHPLLPDGNTAERVRAALEPEALAVALRTLAGLRGIQAAVRASFVPAVTAPQLEDVQASLEELLGALEPGD